jgi:hypothetical protein
VRHFNNLNSGPASIVYNENGTREEEEEPDNLTEDLSFVSSQHSKPPSRVPSAAGTPRTRSPSRGPEVSTPSVSNGAPRSLYAASPTRSPLPIVEERKKSSTSRAISIQSHGSASHQPTPSTSSQVQTPSQAHLSPKIASTPITTSRSIPTATPTAPAQASLIPVEPIYSLASTPSKHASPSHNTPTHSRSASIARAAAAASNVVFPVVLTPPVVESRKASPSRNGYVAAEPPPSAPVESRKTSISSRHADPPPVVIPVVVEPRNTFSSPRNNPGTPTPANSTAQSPALSVAPPAVAPSPPANNVTERTARKSRNASTASATPSMIPSPAIPVEKAATASDSTGLTYATPTPLVRSTKSSLSRRDQSPLGETLNGIWGQSKSGTPSATASPWKGGRPLDPPPATVAEIRKELSNNSSSPPIVGDSQKPLETILEPPNDPRPESVVAGDQKRELQSRDVQEQAAPVQIQVQGQQPAAEQSSKAIDPESIPVFTRDLAWDQDQSSKIPGGFDDLLGDVTQAEQVKVPPITTNSDKKKSSKKKKNDSKAIPSVSTPIDTTPPTPWASHNDTNVGVKNADSIVQVASIPPVSVPIDSQRQVIDQFFDEKLAEKLEETKEDMVTKALSSGQKEIKPAPNEEEQESFTSSWSSWGKELMTSVSNEMLGGVLRPPSSQPIITDPITESAIVKPPKDQTQTGNPVRSAGAAANTAGAWGSKKSGATTPTVWGAGVTKQIFGQSGATESTFESTGTDPLGSVGELTNESGKRMSAFGTVGFNSKDISLDILSSSNKDKELPIETPIEEPVEQPVEGQPPMPGADSAEHAPDQNQVDLEEDQKFKDMTNAAGEELETLKEADAEHRKVGEILGTIEENKTKDSEGASQAEATAGPGKDETTEEVEVEGDTQPQTQATEQNAAAEVEQGKTKQEETNKTTEENKAEEEDLWGEGEWGVKRKKGKKGKGSKGQTPQAGTPRTTSPKPESGVLPSENLGVAGDEENTGHEEPFLPIENENVAEGAQVNELGDGVEDAEKEEVTKGNSKGAKRKKKGKK